MRRPHRASHTRPSGEPIHSESIIQPSFCPSRDRQHPPRAFPDRVSLAQPSTRRPRAQHGPNLALATVQTRHGSQNSYGRYSVFVPHLSPFPSPFHTRTPACHDAHTPFQDTSTRRRGCVLPHAHRHLPHQTNILGEKYFLPRNNALLQKIYKYKMSTFSSALIFGM